MADLAGGASQVPFPSTSLCIFNLLTDVHRYKHNTKAQLQSIEAKDRRSFSFSFRIMEVSTPRAQKRGTASAGLLSEQALLGGADRRDSSSQVQASEELRAGTGTDNIGVEYLGT